MNFYIEVKSYRGKGKRVSSILIILLVRVSEGGHDIEPEVIERRYIRGIKNLFDIYLPIVDFAFIFDNSEGKHKLLANKQMNDLLNIVDIEGFNLLKKY